MHTIITSTQSVFLLLTTESKFIPTLITDHCHTARQGGHKVGEKNSLSFPGFSTAINLLFHRLLQQKVNEIIPSLRVMMILFTSF